MRTVSTQQTQTITRLEAQNETLDRQIAILNAQERAAKEALRTAELRTKGLKEEMVRLKGTVAQIRGQCATDIRRRDGEIQRLKKHLEGRRGRDNNGSHCGIVVVAPGMSRSQAGSQQMEKAVDLESPEYSLKQETTEFLTLLSQSLSDENDALIRLIRSTLATLRSLQGLPAETHDSAGEQSAVPSQEISATAPPPSFEELATNVDEVLDHLRSILTNPSFVSLEEVEIREDEIIRLRQGWEKMEARWKEAVCLMEGWRKRMVDTGDTINLDDLRLGLDLNSGISATVQPEEESSNLEESALCDDSHISGLEDSFDAAEEPSSVDVLDDPPFINKDLEIAVPVVPKKEVLSPRSPNVRPVFSPRKTSFPSIPEENTQELRDAEVPVAIPSFPPTKQSTKSPKRTSPSPLNVRVFSLPVPVSFFYVPFNIRVAHKATFSAVSNVITNKLDSFFSLHSSKTRQGPGRGRRSATISV